MIRSLRALAVGLIVAALAACGSPATSVNEGHRVGERARDFSLVDAEGNTVRLSDYRGQVVVLDFWATWCPPCRKEIPGFVALQSKYAEQGVVVIGVSLDDGWPKVRSFMGQYGINYPIVLDARGEVPSLYGGIKGIPTTFVIDRDGIIRTVHEGYGPPQLFTKAVEDVL
jgi:peroxiredoxin